MNKQKKISKYIDKGKNLTYLYKNYYHLFTSELFQKALDKGEDLDSLYQYCNQYGNTKLFSDLD